MLSLKRLQLAAPRGAGAAALAVALEDGAPEPLSRVAAEAVAELAPERIGELLDPGLPSHVLASAAQAAGATSSRRLGPVLLDLLEHRDDDVRAAAKRGLYRLTGGHPASLARLDTDAWPAEAYEDAVFEIRDWWRRTYEMGRLDD